MAWDFDGTDDYISIADASVLTFAGGSTPFAIGGWAKKSVNTGTSADYIMSWGNYGVSPSLNLLIYEASHATLANRIEFNYRGVFIRPTDTTPGTDTGWQHILLMRVASTGAINLYRNGTVLGDVTNVNGCDVAAAWHIGTRNTIAQLFPGQMAEWFKIDRELSARERVSLAAGMSPLDLPGIFDATSWYLPMYAGAYTEIADRLTLTANGSPVAARHPPVQMPFARRQTRLIVADTVTFSPAWAAQPGLVGGVLA